MKYLELTKENINEIAELMSVFAIAFEDANSYALKKPSFEYTKKLLENQNNIVVVAINDQGAIVGGLVAYELQKFEQERSEIYLYDLAVLEEYRKRGIATRLICELKEIARTRDAYVIFVQADNVDTPAVALYTKLAGSVESDITHFDMFVDKK